MVSTSGITMEKATVESEEPKSPEQRREWAKKHLTPGVVVETRMGQKRIGFVVGLVERPWSYQIGREEMTGVALEAKVRFTDSMGHVTAVEPDMLRPCENAVEALAALGLLEGR